MTDSTHFEEENVIFLRRTKLIACHFKDDKLFKKNVRDFFNKLRKQEVVT